MVIEPVESTFKVVKRKSKESQKSFTNASVQFRRLRWNYKLKKVVDGGMFAPASATEKEVKERDITDVGFIPPRDFKAGTA